VTDSHIRLSGTGRHDRAAAALISTYVRELLMHEAPDSAATADAQSGEPTASPDLPQGSDVNG
jgi:hypothetical protein